MNGVIRDISTAVGLEATYLLLIGVLGTLIMLSLGRGRLADGTRLSALYGAITTFLISRICALHMDGSAAALFAISFSILNAVGFYLLLRSLEFLVRSPAPNGPMKGHATGLWNMGPERLMVYGGFIGALAYVVTPQAESSSSFFVSMANAWLVGATLPVVVCVFRQAMKSRLGMTPYLVLSATLLTVSWLMYEAMLVTSGETARQIGVSARGIDIVTLFFVLATIISNYVRLGVYYKTQASESEAQKDEAKTELEKLNRIATNLYEDSSDLIRKQKEQNLQLTRKVESLEKMLEIGVTLQRRYRLEDVLQQVVEIVRDNLGFKTVTLRLYNEKAQNFETSAHVGLSEEMRDKVLNYRIPLVEYKKMVEPRFRISNSYFIHNSSQWYGEELDIRDRRVLVEDTWGDIDMLVVPLYDEDQETIGYLSVENPNDPKFSMADVIQSLEQIASLAVIGIRNARFLKQLESKNTKLRVYADKLSSLNKLKSNFVATISHEFRTPLTSIKAYCDTLLKNVDNVDRQLLKQFLVVIDEESVRLMSLIEDILDFSQMVSGAMKTDRNQCNVVDIARRACKDLESNYRNRNVTLHRDFPDEPLMMDAEAELLKQLFVNLLHNASKFTHENGNVWFRIEVDNSKVKFCVEDDGMGVPEEQLGKIFEQFHQADGADNRRAGGSGLGLAICKNIVEWHDGRIWVENIRDRGARFVAILPRRQVVVKANAFASYSTVRRFEIETVLELIVGNVAELLQVRKASIMLLDSNGEAMRINCATDIDPDIVEKAVVRPGEGIAGKVLSEGKSVLVTDIEQDERFARSNNDPIYQSKSFLSVPIMENGEVVGVINAASPTKKPVLDDEDRELLELLADRVSAALASLKKFAHASLKYESVRDALKAILDTRRYIDIHDAGLILDIVERTAEKLGLSPEQVSRMRYTLHVYDLGLSKVGYHIVKKPAELSPKDRQEIEEHANMGADMLSSIEPTDDIQRIVRAHHENWDGSGYPMELKGEEIPLEARILRVIDTLRAMISERPYQRQYSFEEAVDVLKHRSGTYFDPSVVEAVLEVLQEVKVEDTAEGAVQND